MKKITKRMLAQWLIDRSSCTEAPIELMIEKLPFSQTAEMLAYPMLGWLVLEVLRELERRGEVKRCRLPDQITRGGVPIAYKGQVAWHQTEL